MARVKDGPLTASHGARPAETGDLQQSLRNLLAMPCFTGLRYLTKPPIVHDGDLLGRAIFGPFRPDDLKDFPDSLTSISEDFDSTRAQKLVEKIRRAPEATVARVMLHFSQVLRFLLASGQKIFLMLRQIHVEATLLQNRELQRKNEDLKVAYAKLRELDRLKSAFSGNRQPRAPHPSHQHHRLLRNAVRRLGRRTQRRATGTRQNHRGNREALLTLIGSISDTSQIEAGKVRLVFHPVSIFDLVKEAVSSVRPQALKKGIQLETWFPGNALQVQADAERLKQVVVNLLANAVKFTPPHGKITVSVSPRPSSRKSTPRATASPSTTLASAFPRNTWSRYFTASSKSTPAARENTGAPAWDSRL